MRYLIVILTIVGLTVSGCTTTYFEGVIRFENRYKNLLPLAASEDLLLERGSFLNLTIKEDKLKAEFPDASNPFSLYYFDKWNDGRPACFHFSEAYGVLAVDMFSYHHVIKEIGEELSYDTIMGIDCEAIQFTTVDSIIGVYVFNVEHLKVNPNLLRRWKIGFLNDFSERFNVYPLRSISQTSEYWRSSEAVEINRVKIDDQEFALPDTLGLAEALRERETHLSRR